MSYRKSNAFEAPNIPGPSGSNQNGFVDVLNEQFVVGSTYAFKNATVLDIRFARSIIDAGKRPPLTGGPSPFELYGITGLPNDPEINGSLTTQTITGLSQLGQQATNPQFQNSTNNDIRASYAFSFGRHSLKTGYEHLAVNTEVQDTNPLLGLDTYSGQFSRPTGAAANNVYNLALPAAQRPSLQARRPIQGFGSIPAVLPEGFSNYNALQIKVERRFSQGLYFLNSFTFSKTLDNASQVLEEPNGNTGTPQNLYNIDSNKGIGAYDQPFNNTTSFVFELPFGRGRWLATELNPVLDTIFGGRVLSGVNTMTSGQPINFRYGPSPVTNNLPTFLGGVALRPNVICDPVNPKHVQTRHPVISCVPV